MEGSEGGAPTVKFSNLKILKKGGSNEQFATRKAKELENQGYKVHVTKANDGRIFLTADREIPPGIKAGERTR